MCLDLKRTINRPSRVLTARRDYTVYKLLREAEATTIFRTPFQRERYDRNTTKTVPSFSTNVVGVGHVEFTDAIPERSYSIHKGLHAYQSRTEAIARGKSGGYLVVECIIPKGTKYIRGSWDIVSLSLKVGKAVGRSKAARAFNGKK